MSRAIKFRQYVDGKWYQWGFGLPDNGNGFASPVSLKAPSYQFTGLLDKNGKEIYEGDIVAGEWESSLPRRTVTTIGQVGFGEGCFQLRVEIEASALRLYDSLEVIGNIYESPELLSKEQSS